MPKKYGKNPRSYTLNLQNKDSCKSRKKIFEEICIPEIVSEEIGKKEKIICEGILGKFLKEFVIECSIQYQRHPWENSQKHRKRRYTRTNSCGNSSNKPWNNLWRSSKKSLQKYLYDLMGKSQRNILYSSWRDRPGISKGYTQKNSWWFL